MATYKLPTQQLKLTGNSGGVRASLLDASQVSAGVRVPSLRGVNIPQTQVPIPKVQRDRTLDFATEFGDTLVNSAFRVREKQDNFLATEAALEYADFARKKFYGYTDENGVRVKGFADAKGADALDAAVPYQQAIEAKLREVAQRLSPSARQRAMLRLADTRATALNRGTRWYARQQRVADDQARFVELEGVRAEIEANTLNAWVGHEGMPSMVAQHAQKYADPKQAARVIDDLAKFTIHRAYNNAGEGVKKKYDAAKQVFDLLKTEVPRKTKQEINFWLSKKKDALAAQRKIEAKKAEKRIRISYNANAAGELLRQSEIPGNGKNMVKVVEGLYKVNAMAADGGQKEVTDTLKDVFYITAHKAKDISAAVTLYNEMAQEGLALDGESSVKINEYLTIKLPQQLYDKKVLDSVTTMRGLKDKVEEVRKGGTTRQDAQQLINGFLATDPDMKTAEAFRKQVWNAYDAPRKAEEREANAVKAQNDSIWLDNVRAGRIAQADLPLLAAEVAGDRLSSKVYTAAVDVAIGADPVMKAIRSSPEYKQASNTIDTMMKAPLWSENLVENRKGASALRHEMNVWAKQQYADKNFFPNYHQFINERMEEQKAGNATGLSFWNGLYGNTEEHPSVWGKAVKAAKDWYTGEGTIMDDTK